ncbi:Cysteine-rich CWC [Paenibacillus sp. NFR01]|nr:Cysteine-rich CWC [Paenibacillus sp. NFR01]
MNTDSRFTNLLPPEAVCPGCGGDNGCAVAHDQPAESCWCMTLSLPAEALNRVKRKYPGSACLCRDCLMKLAADLPATTA